MISVDTYDALKIREQKLAARREVERQRSLEAWPTECPTCFAGPGERCFTRNGKKALRHKGRPRAGELARGGD